MELIEEVSKSHDLKVYHTVREVERVREDLSKKVDAVALNSKFSKLRKAVISSTQEIMNLELEQFRN